jgi:hypothetical protein
MKQGWLDCTRGDANRCRLFSLTNSALVRYTYEPKCGGWRRQGVSTNEYTCAQGAQINFGDLLKFHIFLTYGLYLC